MSVCDRCKKEIEQDANGYWKHKVPDKTTHHIRPKDVHFKGFGKRSEAEEFGKTLAARKLHYKIVVQGGLISTYIVEWRE